MRSSAATYPRWVADIGGTNARFAWVAGEGDSLTDDATYLCADHATLLDAMRHYLAAHGKAPPPWCAIGIATPVLGDTVRMTNHHWTFSIDALRQQLGLQRLVVINDFTALALSLPSLRADELRQVGEGARVEGAAIALIGPGTGLGVSGLLPVAGRTGWVPISGEGGHITLGGADDFENQVIARLRQRFGHASAERALSGPGLVNLYRALCELEGVSPQELAAAEVAAKAHADPHGSCGRAVALFFSLLGTVAGNLALTLGARGGVFIGGGIAAKLGDAIDKSGFRERFVDKGRYREYLEGIPTLLINAQTSPALRGALCALDE